MVGRITLIGLVGYAAVASAVLSGCDQGLSAGVGVDNKTNLELRFEVFIDGRSYRPPAIAHKRQTAVVVPASILSKGGCTSGAMVALTEDGREVARHEAPLCVGDVWTIEEPSPSPT